MKEVALNLQPIRDSKASERRERERKLGAVRSLYYHGLEPNSSKLTDQDNKGKSNKYPDLPTPKTVKSADFEKSREKPGDWDLKPGYFQNMR